jgi:hypothetical protein
VPKFYGRELNRRITTLAKAVELVRRLATGVVAGLIVISLILPIFKLSRAVSWSGEKRKRPIQNARNGLQYWGGRGFIP